MYVAYGKLYMITLCSYNDLKYFEQLSVMLKYTSSFDNVAKPLKLSIRIPCKQNLLIKI